MMHSLPPCPPAIYRLDTASPARSYPDDQEEDRHLEERPDTSILEDFRATQVSFAVTGALVSGHPAMNLSPRSDPWLIEVANRCLYEWWIKYQKSRGGNFGCESSSSLTSGGSASRRSRPCSIATLALQTTLGRIPSIPP